MASILKGARGSDLTGLLNLTKHDTLFTQVESICASDLGGSFSSITPAMVQQAKNDLCVEIIQNLGYGTDEGLMMADAAVMGYVLTLSLSYSGVNAKQVAVGSAIGVYAGYLAHDPCCGVDREALEVTAVFAQLAMMQATTSLIRANLQTAWNALATLGLAS
jgi:hypothetical protein